MPHAVHLLRTCYAHAMNMHMPCTCYAYAMHMPCTCHAHVMLCTCHAYAMPCHAHAMHMLCTCHAQAMHGPCACCAGHGRAARAGRELNVLRAQQSRGGGRGGAGSRAYHTTDERGLQLPLPYIGTGLRLLEPTQGAAQLWLGRHPCQGTVGGASCWKCRLGSATARLPAPRLLSANCPGHPHHVHHGEQLAVWDGSERVDAAAPSGCRGRRPH